MYGPGGGMDAGAAPAPATEPRDDPRGRGMYEPGGSPGAGVYGPGTGMYGPGPGTGMYGPAGGTGMYGPAQRTTQPSQLNLIADIRFPDGYLASRLGLGPAGSDARTPLAADRATPFVACLRIHVEDGLTPAAWSAMLDRARPVAELPQDVIDALRLGTGVLDIVPAGGPGGLMTEYDIIVAAPSPAQLLEVARAIMRIYNAAWPQVRQAYLMATTEEWLQRDCSKLHEKSERLMAYQRALQGLERMHEATINDLRTSLLLLGVEIAGVEARLKAAQDRLEPYRREGMGGFQTLEDIAVAAQIDLAALLAKREATASMLNAAEQLNALRKDVDGLQLRVKGLQEQLQGRAAYLQQPPADMGVDSPLQVFRIPPEQPPAPMPETGR
ncbi:MAG: hypothetical protein GX591_04240 [Planctomycetes bacterium]|nr:hypothetical protein [Planctomycetota bacterium]